MSSTTTSASQSRYARLAVSGLLIMCNSTFRRSLPRICGSSEAALRNIYILWILSNSGIKLDSFSEVG